ITREALSAAFDHKLLSDPVSLQQIEAIFAARGRSMPERNHRHALRPEHSESIPNHCGTAPGILMRVELPGTKNDPAHRCLIGVMPGVPAEMKPMFTLQIRP
ncbi:MAG: molybdopterin-binding protein, partial [Phycisphaerae bacterium]